MAQGKKVIDEVSGWRRALDDGSVDRTFTGPSQVKFLTDAMPPHHHFVDGVATTDTTSTEGLNLRIYLPKRQENDLAKLPILLHFHGGGFCFGEADWFMFYAVYTRLAREARAIVVSVFYGRLPSTVSPAPIDDAFAALMWLRSAARGHSHHPWLHDHADFNRVFLIGDSAGGNMAHEVAARAGNENINPLRVVGAILLHPAFMRSRRSKSELEQPQTPFFNLDMLDKCMRLALPGGSHQGPPDNLPDGEGCAAAGGLMLPPYLCCVAEQDLMSSTQMEFYEAMKRANKEVELFFSNGIGHFFYANKIAVDNDPKQLTRLRNCLRGSKCSSTSIEFGG